MKITNKILISSFILFNFLIMARVHMPLNEKFFSKVYRPVDAYLSFFSLYQDWMMFAPNPGKTNILLTASVEFDDGSKENYEFPNPQNMDVFQKYSSGEKFRKIISEGIRKDSNSFMWQDTAKFVLRKMKNEHFDKIPMKVELIRHWDDIPLMSKKFRNHRLVSNDYQKNTFYTYEVMK